MKMNGEQRIAAPKQRVWEALNDPDVLRQSIPGCQTLEKEADDRLKATVAIKVGPMDARFAGAVTLGDLDPPNAYTISGEGQGGTAGFAKGSAKVRLTEDGGGTLLSYDVDAQVGGRLAQLGGPIIDATAKQLAGSFFKKFGEIVAPTVAPATAAAATGGGPSAPRPMQSRAPGDVAAPAGLPIAWILAIVVAALAGFLFGQTQASDPMSGWAGLFLGALVVIVAAGGYEFGRRAAAPIIVLDPTLLKRLIAQLKERS